jgi:hypothetical protein
VSGRDAAGPNVRYGVGMAFFGSLMSACFLIPWKLAAEYGEPRLAVLVMLTVAATLNSMTAAFEARRAGAAARAGVRGTTRPRRGVPYLEPWVRSPRRTNRRRVE